MHNSLYENSNSVPFTFILAPENIGNLNINAGTTLLLKAIAN